MAPSRETTVASAAVYADVVSDCKGFDFIGLWSEGFRSKFEVVTLVAGFNQEKTSV